MLGDIVKSCFEKAQEQQKAGGYIKLEPLVECGFATIPLPGIDVPFHSWAGVLPFRACMLTFSHNEFPFELIFFFQIFSRKSILVILTQICFKLWAKPFDVSREYTQIIYDQTSSPKLDKVLKKWEQEKWDSAENHQKLAYIILVEFLAYQFASLVVGSRPRISYLPPSILNVSLS